jgi:alkaline phosphatase D
MRPKQAPWPSNRTPAKPERALRHDRAEPLVFGDFDRQYLALAFREGPAGPQENAVGPRDRPDWTDNLLLRHGVRSCLEYAKSFDLRRARALSNPELAPHLEFVDMGGHGYAKVRLTGDTMRTAFVCIPRPISRSASPDGGPLRYRVAHVAKLWGPGERPRLEQQVLEGNVGLSI